MVRQRAKAVKKVEDTTWIPKAVEIVRDMTAQGFAIDVHTFAEAAGLEGDTDLSEQRLRKLTQVGWVHMSAEHVAGRFVRFIWTLR